MAQPPPLPTVRSIAELRAVLRQWRQAGQTVGLVPTMGALHDGHLALVSAAKAACDRAVATIFVNPKQFDRKDDLDSYPRTEEEDSRLLAERNADLLFAPPGREVYPESFSTNVSVQALTDCLDGVHRPGHFDGVTTVVAKLLLQSLPDKAFFGEKDFQQLSIVSRMVRDLDMPVEIVPVGTVRQSDGLALSSRNKLLTAEQRKVAPLLYATLKEIADRLANEPGLRAEPLLSAGRHSLALGGFANVDYLELRAADDLAALDRVTRPARVFAAAWLGNTRLIDNLPVEPAT